jgi:molybdopterin converting factor small subunit
MSQPEITVLYFAAASTVTGLTEQSVTLPASQYPLSSLSGFLVSLHPDVGLDKILQSSQWSVNAEMVDNVEEVTLKGGEEVAVICPVSGG